MKYLSSLETIPNSTSLYIYGAGAMGFMLHDSILKYRTDINIKGFIDSHKKGIFLNRSIYSPSEISQNSEEQETLILVASHPTYWTDIFTSLERFNFKNIKINKFCDYDIFGSKNFLNRFLNHYKDVRGLLNPDSIDSWNTLVKSISSQDISHLEKWLSLTPHKASYTDKNVYISEGDYVFDGGAFSYDKPNIFSQLAGSTGKVFAFDLRFNSDSAAEKNVEKYCLSLWNEECSLYFNEESGRSTVSTTKSDNSITVNATSIDHFIRKSEVKKFDFLKLDIEGSELEALKGAMSSIKLFRPKLSISIYHKLEHYIEIPLYLSQNLTNYEYFFQVTNPYGVGSLLLARPKQGIK